MPRIPVAALPTTEAQCAIQRLVALIGRSRQGVVLRQFDRGSGFGGRPDLGAPAVPCFLWD
jgi:hypothetical protein